MDIRNPLTDDYWRLTTYYLLLTITTIHLIIRQVNRSQTLCIKEKDNKNDYPDYELTRIT